MRGRQGFSAERRPATGPLAGLPSDGRSWSEEADRGSSAAAVRRQCLYEERRSRASMVGGCRTDIGDWRLQSPSPCRRPHLGPSEQLPVPNARSVHRIAFLNNFKSYPFFDKLPTSLLSSFFSSLPSKDHVRITLLTSCFKRFSVHIYPTPSHDH